MSFVCAESQQSQRRTGRTEETHLVLSNMLRKASHDLDM